ncbi:MAG: OPT/YSL family transporter [Planctomycetes bacterium]|nr:OPT/YSL family transporter [Planctomycetota bacterium]
MGIFQKAPRTAEEFEACAPLDLSPSEVAEFDEAEWYAKAYRGETPQLTLRAVLMGSVLGFFLAFTNLYIGLKTGWHLGVAITACILSYSIWQGMLRFGLAKTNMTILENNCMQSTASAAGYSTGGTFVSAIAALLMIQGVHLPIWVLVVWTFFLAILGVTLAIPMKRNMINQEKLKFPSGLAAASTLQSLYADGAEATRKARALMWSGLAGAVVPFLIDAHFIIDKLKSTADAVVYKTLLPGSSKLFDWLPHVGTKLNESGVSEIAKPSDWTLRMDHNPVMIAAGALVGLRVAIWMTVSGLVLAFLLGPAAQEYLWVNLDGDTVAAVTKPGKAWKEIGLWFGAPIMVASGLMAFAFQWKTIARALSGMGKKGDDADTKDGVEVPNSWFVIGMIASACGVIFVANSEFDVPVHLGVLAVALTFILALVACRATGESDITPTGAMGKIMQLTYGVLIPQSATANLMTAGITAGAASSSADLLNDLKSGYLLGANPKRQFLAQFFGIFTGTIATVIGFKLLVPDVTALVGQTLADGTEIAPAFPAPAAVAWKAVADVFNSGIGNLHEMHRSAIFVGLGVGVLLTVIDRFAPKDIKKYLPSATGVGLGFILPFQYPLSMLIGAVIAYYWGKRNQEQCDGYLVPIASGIIAGVSIMGVVAAALNNFVFVNGGGGH